MPAAARSLDRLLRGVGNRFRAVAGAKRRNERHIMTTFHNATRTATIDRRTLVVRLEDGETAICSSLEQATEYALGHVTASELPAQPDTETTSLYTALLDAIANSTTWRK